jgi:hypothetical protein
MERFDPAIRARVLRVALALIAAVGVSALIGLSLDRSPNLPGAAQPTAQASASPTDQPTAAPSPSPAPTPTSLPTTLLPDDGWLIRSRETFDSVSSWPAQEQPGWGAGYQDGRYWLKLDGQQTISYRLPLEATEFRIGADVQAQGGYAGLVFLASEPNILYRFQIDDAGRYRLGYRQGSELTSLIDWTAAAALKSGPQAVNQLEVRRVENVITLLANDTELASYPLPEGEQFQAVLGMTLDAIARDSVAMAYFDNLMVRVPEVPASP